MGHRVVKYCSIWQLGQIVFEVYLKYSKAVLTATWYFAVVEQYGCKPKLGASQLAYFILLNCCFI